MANIDFGKIFKDIEDQTKALAQKEIKEYTNAAVADVKGSLQEAKEDFEEWVKQLAAGDLQPDEFKSLVKGEVEVEKMRALKQAGLAQVRIESFVNGVIDIVVNAALAAIP